MTKENQIRFFSYFPATSLRVAGDDAFAFLQGQFTNELRQEPESVVYGLWLNQKGRVLADSFVLRSGEKEFMLVSLASPVSIILPRLEGYIVADDVLVADATDSMRGLAVWGEAGGARLGALLKKIPDRGRFVRQDQLVVFAGRRADVENYEFIGPAQAIGELRKKLLELDCAEADANTTELARISAAFPAVPADIGPTDLPNEGRLEQTAISYTKGCFLGQEVMARIKNLGQVRRMLRVVRGAGEMPPSGAALFQADKRVGEIRSAAETTGGFLAMAMLTKLGLKEGGNLALAPGGPETLRIQQHG